MCPSWNYGNSNRQPISDSGRSSGSRANEIAGPHNFCHKTNDKNNTEYLKNVDWENTMLKHLQINICHNNTAFWFRLTRDNIILMKVCLLFCSRLYFNKSHRLQINHSMDIFLFMTAKHFSLNLRQRTVSCLYLNSCAGDGNTTLPKWIKKGTCSEEVQLTFVWIESGDQNEKNYQ